MASHSYHESSVHISPAAERVVKSLHHDHGGPNPIKPIAIALALEPKPVIPKPPSVVAHGPVKPAPTSIVGSIYDPFYLCNLVSAVVYLVSPALAFIPPLTALVLPPNYDPTVLVGFQSLLTIVAPISFIYFFAIFNSIHFGPPTPSNPYSNLLILTIMWRFLFVGPTVSYDGGIGAFNVLCWLLVLFADILMPVLSIILTSYDVKINALMSVFISETPKKAINRLLGILSIAGIVVTYGVQVYIYFNPTSITVQTVILPVIALYYIYLYFISKQSGTEDFLNVALLVHIILFVAILLNGLWKWDAWIVEILAAFQGLSLFLWIYTLLWTYVIEKYSILIWMSMMSVLVASLSFVWIQFKGKFIETAQQLAPGIHHQDLLISVFMFLCALLVQHIKSTSIIFNAELVSWILPMSSIWFTLETKLLANLHQGSPFHPSWFERGLTPLWATDQVLNVTFWLATTFMTAISTYYTGLTILLHLDTTGWLIYTFNGILDIALSATWMIISSSGLPAPVYTESFPYLVKPLIPVDAKEAVKIHLFDLYTGIALITVGIILKVASDKKILPVSYNKTVTCVLLSLVWALFASPKIMLMINSSASSLSSSSSSSSGFIVPPGEDHYNNETSYTTNFDTLQ